MRFNTIFAFLLITSASLAQSAPAGSLPSACGPNDVKFSVHTEARPSLVPEIPQGSSRLVVFSESFNVGSRCGGSVTRLGLDGKWVGANCLGSYSSIDIAPGEHHLCANAGSKEGVKYTALNSFSAEPGKTYYFRALVFLGVFDPETFIHLDPLDADEGAYLMGSWDVSKSQPK
jgi:hypothetical protein